MEHCHILEGNISVKAALLANRRTFYKIVVDAHKNDKDTLFILRKAAERNILIETLDRTAIDALAEGKTHGGMLAYTGERTYDELSAAKTKEPCFFAILEGIEDPFNFGYILRTLYAAGCDGVILTRRNWSSAAAVVAKSSAGASEYIPMMVCDDMRELCEQLKKAKIQLICGQRKDAVNLYDYTFPDRICIAIGGEMRGLSKAVQAYSDQNLFIPYAHDFRNALNAASAAAVFAFEYVRQKEMK